MLVSGGWCIRLRARRAVSLRETFSEVLTVKPDNNDKRPVPLPTVCACQYPHMEHLPELVEATVAALQTRSTVAHVCRDSLPNSQVVVRILDLLSEAMFPGYFSQRSLDEANLPYHIGETLNAVYGLLCMEIGRCLTHERRRTGALSGPNCGVLAREHTGALLAKLPQLIHMLDGDVHAGYAGDPAATGPDEIIFCYPGFRAIMVQRLAHALHEQGVFWLPRMMTEYAHSVTGIDIHPGAHIGPNFFIDHGTGVVIGETTVIGADVRLYQGVTLGAWSFRTDDDGNVERGYKRHPTLEDDIIVYSGASILGDITIGRGSIVGGNVVLTESVPPGSVVFPEKSKPRVKPRKAD
jgi:serine O-acetyltransferase